jgi:arylsulfatase A-like enzyme
VPHRIAALTLITVSAILLSIHPAECEEYDNKARVPNVVLVLADDLGWSDTTLYGQTKFYRTPNVQRLSERGMLFTQAYAANPLCSPTRASIMTGLYPARIGITAPACHLKEEIFEETLEARGSPRNKALQCRSATRLRQEYFTLAEVLKQAGYATGHFGKWHLGAEPYSPLEQGFDVDKPHWPGPGPAGSYVAPWKFPPALDFPGTPGEHIEDRMASEAVKFIQANKDRPFFLNYWQFSVHAPFDAKAELIEKYKALVDPADPQRCPTYAAMVESLDDAVGTLTRTLDELHLAEKTIVIFFSDNGGNMYNRVEGETPTSNFPLRGGKATIYEGGTREPCFVVWPGVVKAGSVNDTVIQSIDLYPTILEMLGLAAQPGQALDGTSIVPLLKGGRIDREAIFCHFPHYTPATGAKPSTYVRQGDWKLIRFFADSDDQTDRFELYNLAEDLGESQNRAEEFPEQVRRLDALVSRHLEEIGACVPRPNPAWRPGGLTSWGPGADAEAEFRDGLAVVQSKTGRPTLELLESPSGAGRFVVSFRMRVRNAKSGVVLWGTTKAPGFATQRRVLFTPQADGQWHDYTAAFEVDDPLASLRIDGNMAPGEVEFDSIRLEEGDGTVIKEWGFGDSPRSQ